MVYMSCVTPGMVNTEMTSFTDRPTASEISTMLNPFSDFSRSLAFRSGSAALATPISVCDDVATRVARKLIAQLINRNSPIAGRIRETGHEYPGLPCHASKVNGQPPGSAQKGIGHWAARNICCEMPVSSTGSWSMAGGMFNGKSTPSATTR